MIVYIVKRLLFLIPTVLGVTLIIFIVMNITPGDPARALLGASASQESVDQLNHELGYDQPFLTKYVNYLERIVVKQDFGTSYFTKQPVIKEIWPRFKITVLLSLIGVLLSVLIGVPLGVLTAVKQYSLLDSIPSLFAFLFAAIPSFVIGMVMLYYFSLTLNWLPSYFRDVSLKYMIMPAFTIAIPTAAQNLRFTKSSMLEEIRQDYARTVRAKGATEQHIIWKHVLKNALLPVITNIGMSLGMFIAGAVVAERLFAIPGIGSLIVDRISSKDEPVIIAGTILISITFTVIMLIMDLVYAYIDPRIRAKYAKLKA